MVNSFKKALTQGQPQYGCWLAMANAYSAEIAATAGFDWLLIDGEHAPHDLKSTLAQLQAMAPYPSNSVVRLADADPVAVKQMLDIGATNLLIPMIETPEQAQLMARSIQYPPEGIRGVGAAIARASRWNLNANYHSDEAKQICLLLQIETVAGCDNLDDILAVDGFDGIFIGPSDLAASMGQIGNTGHSAVQERIAEAIGKIVASGKAAGILTTEAEMVEHYRALGATFIAVGVDVLELASALRSLARSYR